MFSSCQVGEHLKLELFGEIFFSVRLGFGILSASFKKLFLSYASLWLVDLFSLHFHSSIVLLRNDSVKQHWPPCTKFPVYVENLSYFCYML